MEGLDYIREKVRRRDNYTCQGCQKVWQPGQRRLDVHHLDPERESKKDYTWDRANMHRMITLCHKCHMNLYHLRANAKAKARERERNWGRTKEQGEVINTFKSWGITTADIAHYFNISSQRVNRIWRDY